MSNYLVSFDDQGVFEIVDPALADVVSAGWGVKVNVNASENNTTCGTNVNGECKGPNESCLAAIDNVCGPNNECSGLGTRASGNIGCL